MSIAACVPQTVGSFVNPLGVMALLGKKQCRKNLTAIYLACEKSRLLATSIHK